MDRLFYICAGLTGFTAFALGFLGAALGAFAAHGLKAVVEPDMVAVFEAGARYQMYHAFALFAAAWGWARWGTRAFSAAGWLFVIGVVVFCGSLYVIALTGARWLGAITPFGGVAFLTGWLCLAVGAFRAPRNRV